MPSYLPVDKLAFRRALAAALIVTAFWSVVAYTYLGGLYMTYFHPTNDAHFLNGALELTYGGVVFILVSWWLWYQWRVALRLKPHTLHVDATDNEQRGVPELDIVPQRHMSFRDDGEAPPTRW